VVGAAHIGSSGTDWVFAGMMRFPGDVVALFDCGTSLPNRDELEAIGTEGSLFLDDPWHCGTPVIELRRNDSVERIEIEAANPYRLELEDLNAAHPRRAAAAARARGRDGPGARDRRVVPLAGGWRRAGPALEA